MGHGNAELHPQQEIFNMSMSVGSESLNPTIITQAVQAKLAQKDAFFGSLAVQLGIVDTNDTFDESDPDRIGQTVNVPRFGVVPDFVPNPDGNEAEFQKAMKTAVDPGTIERDTLAVQMTRWFTKNGGKGSSDPYEEFARQTAIKATKAMDVACMAQAVADGTPTVTLYSASSPVLLHPDHLDDAMTLFWGDEIDDAGGVVIAHSKTVSHLSRLKTNNGEYLLKQPEQTSMPFMLSGRPLIRSDRGLLAGSSMGAVTSTGTSPPTLTLSGEPLGPWDLRFKCTVGGALGTAKFKFSTDGGNTWSAEFTTAASVVLMDTAADSVIGVNGATGITAAFASATFNADNTWRSIAALKVTTLICAKGSLAFWFNRRALQLQSQPNIAADAMKYAMHLYRVAVRRGRATSISKPGVIRIVHNVPAVAT